MFKYILLGTLLVHTSCAKPVEHHVEAAPHVVFVTPQAQFSLDTPVTPHHTPLVRYIAPHEESIVYVPASEIQQHSHHHPIIGRSSDGVQLKQLNEQLIGYYKPTIEIPDFPIKELNNQNFNLAQLIQQQYQRIVKLEQEIKNLKEKHSGIILLQQKSFGNEHHQYVVEQPHQVVEYIPFVVNSGSLTPTVKARRSILPEVQEDVKLVAVEDNKPVQLDQAVPIIAKLSSDLNSVQQQVVASEEDAKKEVEPVVHEQARSLEADKQNNDQKPEGLIQDKEPAATEKPSEILLENNDNSADSLVRGSWGESL